MIWLRYTCSLPWSRSALCRGSSLVRWSAHQVGRLLPRLGVRHAGGATWRLACSF